MKAFTCVLVLASAVCVLCVLGAPATAQAGCNHSSEPVRSISKDNARGAIQCLFNRHRSAGNVKRNGDLEQAAQNHSSVMASKRCFSHQCPGEAGLKDRVARTGYLQGASNYELGEVLIYGSSASSSREIVSRWFDSPPHRSTIMKSSFDHVGVGLSMRTGVLFATADFGSK